MAKEIKIRMDIEGNAKEALESIQKAYEQINKAAKDALKSTEGLGGGTNTPPKIPTQTQLTGREVKREFRKDKEDLIAMAMAGDTASESFKKLQEKTGETRDNLDEVNNRIKYFSSDTKGMDSMVESIKAIGGAAQIGVGGMELLGISSDTAMQTVAKLASIESVLTGVKQLQATVQRDSVFMLGLENAKTKLLTVSTIAYSAIVGQTSGALKGLKLALAGTGIGAAVLLFGALSTAIYSAYNATKDLQKADEDRQNKLNEAATKGSDTMRTEKEKQNQLRIDILRAQGKEKEADDLDAKYKLDNIRELEKAQAQQLKDKENIIAKIAKKEAELKKAKEEETKSGGKVTMGGAGISNEMVASSNAKIANITTALTALRAEEAKLKYVVGGTTAKVATAYLEAQLTQQKAKNSKVSKQESVSASAPKTFNVYIQSLGEIQTVNIVSDEDQNAFQQKMVNALTSAITSVQARASK